MDFSKTEVGKVLGVVSGLSAGTMDSLWQAAKDNHRRLQECKAPHDFSIDLRPQQTVGKRWKCQKCSGEIDDAHRVWYVRGLEHARSIP